MPEPIIVEKANASPVLNIVGEQVTVLASGAQTGSYEIFHQAGPEGAGPPPHSHPWDEAFYVIRGEMAFGFGAKELVARPGTLVHLPAGTTHWFRFGPGGGEMVSMPHVKAHRICSPISLARSRRTIPTSASSSRSASRMD